MAERVRRITGSIEDIAGAPSAGVPVSATLTGGTRFRNTVAGKDIDKLTRGVVTADGTVLPAPAAIGAATQTTGGPLADATYWYRVSDEPQGVETALSSALSVVVSASGGAAAVHLTGIPAPAASSLGRVLYRASGASAPALGAYHYLDVLLDPAQTTYTDTTSAADLAAAPAAPTGPMAAGSWRIALVPPADIADLGPGGGTPFYTFSFAGATYQTSVFALDDGSPLALSDLVTSNPPDSGTMTSVYLDAEDITGAPLVGTVTIQLGFDGRSTDSGRYFYGGAPVSYPLIGGHLATTLKPTGRLQPSGNFYRIQVNKGVPWTVVIPDPDPSGHPSGFDLEDPALVVGTVQPGQIKYSEDSIAASAQSDVGTHPPVTLTQELNNLRERIAYMQNASSNTNVRLARDPTTTNEDLIVRRGGQLIRLPKGNDGDVLSVVAGQVAYNNDYIRNPMTAAGSMITATTGGLPIELPIGAEGTYLRSIDGLPTWHTVDTETPVVPTPAFASSTTPALHSPDVVTPTVVDDLSVTLSPLADTAYSVTMSVLLTKGANTIRLGLTVDGTLVYPTPDNGVAIWGGGYDPASGEALSWPAFLGAEAALQAATFTTLLTLAAGTHTVAVVWEAALGTDDVTFYDRALLVIPATAPGPVNPMLATDDLIIGATGGTPARKPVGAIGTLLAVGGDGHVNWLTASLAGLTANPMTAEDDLIVGDPSGVPVRLGVGVPGDVLGVGVGGHLTYIDGSTLGGGGGGGMTNPMTALDQLIVGGTGGTPVALDPGSIGQVVGIDSTGHVGYINQSGGGGGTGMTNPMTTQDDLIVGGTAGAAVRLPKGSDGQVLGIVSGHVAYLTPSAAGMANPMSAVGDLIKGGTAGVPVRLASGVTNNGKVLTVVSGDVAWAALPRASGAATMTHLKINANHVMDGTKDVIFIDASGANIAITVVSANAYDGRSFHFKRLDSSTHTVTLATVTPATNGFIDTQSSRTLPTSMTSWLLFSDNVDWWVL